MSNSNKIRENQSKSSKSFSKIEREQEKFEQQLLKPHSSSKKSKDDDDDFEEDDQIVAHEDYKHIIGDVFSD